MATLDQFRALLPDGDKLSDFEVIQSVSKTLEMDPRTVADHVGYTANAPGIVSDVKRGVGQIVEATGSALRDLGATDTGRAIESYGSGVTFRNPSQINSLSDVADKPFTTAREAVGEVLPQVGGALGVGLAGRALGGVIGGALGSVIPGAGTAAGAAIGQNLGGAAAAYGFNLLQEYGGIRKEQREQGIEDKTRALATGGAAAVLDTAFGAERVVGKFLKEGSDILAREGGTKLLKHVAKQAAIGAATESPTEVGQTALERLGAYKSLTDADAINEYGLAGIKGGIGGGVVRAGMAAVAGEREPLAPPAPPAPPPPSGGNDIQQAFQQPNVSGTPVSIPPAPLAATDAAPATAPAATPAAVPTAPAVQGGTTAVAQAAQAAQAEDAAVQQRLEQQAAREQVYEQFGIASPQDPTKGQLFGQKLFGPSVPAVADALIAATQQMTPVQQELTRAVAFANAETGNQLVKFAFNADKIGPSVGKALESVGKVLTKFQIGHVKSVDEAAQILNELSQSAKGMQLEQINALHVALTGEDSRGFLEASGPTVKKGTSNGQLPVQNASGMGAVREQGQAGAAPEGNAGSVRPGAVQSLGAGSVPEGSLGLQVGQPAAAGVRAGSGAVSGPVDGGVGQAPQVTQGVQNGQQATPAQTADAGQTAVQPAGAAADAAGVQESGVAAGSSVRAENQSAVTDPDADRLADQAESITDEAMKLLVPPTSRMSEETARKQRDFIFTLLANGPYASLEVMAADFVIKLHQAKDWSAKALALREDPTKLKAAFEAVAKARGLTIPELMSRINAKAAAQPKVDLRAGKEDIEDSGQGTSRTEDVLESDEQEFEIPTEEEAAAANASEREVTEEGLAIKGRKSGESVQERFNAVETNQAKYLRLIDQLEKAEQDGNDAEVERLNAELEAVLNKGIAQADKRTKKGQQKAEAPVAKAAPDSDAEKAANEKWKAVKGDLTKLTDDELAGVKARATKFKNDELVAKIDAELAKRGVATQPAAEKPAAEKPAAEKPARAKPSPEEQEKARAEFLAKQERKGQLVLAGKEWGTYADTKTQGKWSDLTSAQQEKWADIVQAGKASIAAANEVAAMTTEVAVRTPQEQYADLTKGFPVPAFDALPKQVQEQITDLAQREQLNLAAVNRILNEAPKALTNEPVTIDVEARVVEETVGKRVLALPEPQVTRLERHYGLKRGTAEFLSKVKEDVVAYVNKGAEAVSAAIRDVIKAISSGVLAMAVIFTPNFNAKGFAFNLPAANAATITQTVEIREQVPANAVAKMSPLAQQVYESMAPVAKKSGKGFIIADKPNGMVHFFNADGSVLVQDAALYGKDAGDVLGKVSSLKGGAKVTPAGTYSLAVADTKDYAGGKLLNLVESQDDTGFIAVHAAYLGDPKENRLGRLNSASAEDNKISYGCINTAHETFLKKVLPNIDAFNGGMIFVLPDAQEATAAMFPAQTKTVTQTVTAAARGDSGRKLFGKDAKVKRPYTAKELLVELKQFLRADIPGRKLLVVDSVEDLLNDPSADIRAVARALADKGAYGVAVDGRAYLIANRINKGQGRAKFMHEVGAHLGLENLLPKAQFDKLVAQIKKWAASDADTDEVTLAARAMLRVENANTPAEDVDSELLAYFIEEAVQGGVNPTADLFRFDSPLRAWFRTLWAAFKVAIRRLGFKPEALEAVDIVNLAFGAARLEIAGTWHGTAASFRKFNHMFMGSGEGAQAFGWGSYLAQRPGIAEGYFKADVQRKSESRYSPQQFRAEIARVKREIADTDLIEDAATRQRVRSQFESRLSALEKELARVLSASSGSLMRVDTSVPENEMLDWDSPLHTQPEVLAKVEEKLPADLREQIEEEANADLADMTGEELYRALEFVERRDGVVSEQFSVEDFNKRLANSPANRVVSAYLDEQLDIGGLKFRDAKSRKLADEKRLRAELEDAKWELENAEAMNDEEQVEYWSYEIEQIIKKLAQGGNATRNFVIFNDKNIFRVGTQVAADRQRMQFGVDSSIERLPKQLQQPTRTVTTNMWTTVKKGGLALAITEDVVNMAKKYMASAADYLKAQYAQQATRLEFELRVEQILQQFDKLPKNLQGTGEGSVNKLIHDMTVDGKWGFAPSYNAKAKIDPDLAKRFNAIKTQSPAAAKLIQDVFEHGHNSLLAKQAAVKAAADKAFAERVRDAAGDQKALADIATDRKAFEAKFERILKIKDDKPYAYLGRYGDYVAVAKSAEFIEAQRLAAEGDLAAAKWVSEHESDANHYMVSFAETQAEADRIAANWKGSGKFSETYASEKLDNSAYVGGSDLFLSFKRMENMLARKARNDAISPDLFDGMRKLMTDLYLSSVAESSAHTSSLTRKNIAGADLDMMRNLATRGRADAHFLAALQHGDQVTDAVDRMLDERKANPREATPLLNELLKRQSKSMEYKLPSTLAQGLTQLSTVYYLSTSPAFYLQQLLQTAVLSLPYMAGRLGYFRSARAIRQAYGDVAKLVKDMSVNDHVDFDKAPEDVKAMLKTLVGMGKIDVGIDADAKARSSDQGVLAKVMRKLQGVNTRIETINRATAAIAAYRGYKQKNPGASDAAAVQYAADVVSNTHGSYDGFNTPRALSSDVGRVVGQFKRFQIIQLSMLGKLLHTAFKSASPQEKAVARQSLKFITAHMAVLGGALGVPFVSQLGNILLGIFGDDDEPKDLEQLLRNALGDPALADLLLRGVPAAAGLESLGKKLAMENVASLLPFTDVNLADRDGLTKVYVALLGPSAALSLKMADGLGMMGKGEYYKGLELMLPTGTANVMKGYRIATDGVTMRNGDTVMGPEEISFMDAAFQSVGLPTTTVTDRQRLQTVVAEADKFYEGKAAQIKLDYVRAFNSGDTTAMADAREAWMELQDARIRNGYARQPMSTLFRAPMQQRKRERSVVDGVEFNKANRRFVEEQI